MNKSTIKSIATPGAVIIAAIIAIIPFMHDFFTMPNPMMSGHIESPRSGNIVGRKINISCNIANIPEDSYVWIAIKINDNIWPKNKLEKMIIIGL